MNSLATPRAWSLWAAVPAATMRAKLRATMVSAVAPHRPMRCFFSAVVSPSFFLGGGTRQGPWAQMRQQAPSMPMGQGFMAAARSQMVSTPSAWAFLINSWAAGSMDSLVKSNSAIKFLLQFRTFRDDLHGPPWETEPDTRKLNHVLRRRQGLSSEKKKTLIQVRRRLSRPVP